MHLLERVLSFRNKYTLSFRVFKKNSLFPCKSVKYMFVKGKRMAAIQAESPWFFIYFVFNVSMIYLPSSEMSIFGSLWFFSKKL